MSEWVHIKRSPSLGLDEQHVFRAANAPLCSLRRDPADDRWAANLLELTGISARTLMYPSTLTLVEAQDRVKADLQHMGWRW